MYNDYIIHNIIHFPRAPSKMQSNQYGQFCQIELEQFLTKSSQIQCKVVGTISTIFKHKYHKMITYFQRYIIETFMNRKPVMRCYKRYNEFEALHELIQMKYKNYKIKELPSKFQLFGKEETRKMYFQNMLNQIVKDHSQEDHHSGGMHETSRRLLSIIYLFLTSSVEEQKLKKLKKSQKKEKLSVQTSQEKMETLYVADYQDTKSETKQRLKSHVELKFLKQKVEQKQRKMSLDLDYEPQVDIRPRCNSLQKQFVSQIKQIKTSSNQFQVKFTHQTSWKKRFIQIKDSSLFFYTNKLDNYFRTNVELYRIRAEFLKRDMNLVDHFAVKMEFDLTRTFNQDPHILSLYHEHDCDKILIRKPLKTGEDPSYSLEVLRKLKDTIVQASQKSPITEDFEGVFNPIGKLFIYVHRICLQWKKHTDEQTIRIRIKTGAMVYQSRPIVYTHQILINQGFLIPISNTFQTVRIECYSVKDQGWVNNQQNMGKIMGIFRFSMVDFLTKPKRYLINKKMVKLETAESKALKYETKVELSIENYSDFSSIYSDSFSNQHDGVPLKQLKGIDDIDDLALTVDRVLRIMGTIALLIQAFWRNIYLFKYPRMGYLFFFIVLLNAIFCDVNDIVREFVAFVLGCVIYQQKYVNIVVSYLMERFLFCRMHPNFKKPLMLSTGEVKYLKWSNQMKYIAEDYEMVQGKLIKKSDKKRTVFQFVVHDRVFTVLEDEQSFFQKVKQAKKIIQLVHKMINSVVCALEKLGNLLSWVDYKRTAFLATLLLILTGLASGWLVRVLVSLFCVHRFYKGLFFYREKHYVRNRMFAVYGLRYIMHKYFPAVIGDSKNDIHLPLAQLDPFICDLVFPIHDQASQKLLKLQMDQIMGVYLEPQALYPKSIKKNYLKLSHIVDMVQSCQSRLKLKWIAGQQGISNQFQQLKEQTREIPIIDIWLEEAVINFIMNTPSQLFMAFYKNPFAEKKSGGGLMKMGSPARSVEEANYAETVLTGQDFQSAEKIEEEEKLLTVSKKGSSKEEQLLDSKSSPSLKNELMKALIKKCINQ